MKEQDPEVLENHSEVDPMKTKGSGNGTRFQMFYYGVAGVLFWSVFIIQLPYINEYFGGVKVPFYVSLVYGFSSNICRIVLMILHSKDRGSVGKRLWRQVCLGSSFTAIGMFAFPICMAIFSTNYPHITFWICLAITGMVGCFNSLMITGGFALMSLSPPGSGQFFLLGLTATGVVTWPLMMLLRWIADSIIPPNYSSTFPVAAFSLCMTGILCLSSIFIYKYKTSRDPNFVAKLRKDEREGAGLIETARKIWSTTILLWISRAVTFSLYPGLVCVWTPKSTSYSEQNFRAFLLYMGPVSDTIGQVLFRFTPLFKKWGDRSLLGITLARAIVLIPLFLLSTYYDSEDSILSADWFRLLLIMTFSISMGINYSLGNARAPAKVDSADEKYTVGVILSFVAMNGLFVGSLIGIGFKELLNV